MLGCNEGIRMVLNLHEQPEKYIYMKAKFSNQNFSILHKL